MKSSLFTSSLTLKRIQLPNKKVFRFPKILGKTYILILSIGKRSCTVQKLCLIIAKKTLKIDRYCGSLLMLPEGKFVCSSLIYRVDGMDARLLYPILCRCKGALQNPKSSRNLLRNETFCKQRGDLPTDMQASRAAEANRIFILCATG